MDVLTVNRRGFLLGTGAVISSALLESCGLIGNEPQPGGSTTAPASTNSTIAAWGDSLTEGGQGGGTPYPAQLATLLGRTVKNLGIDGQTAQQVAGRQGGIAVTLSVQNNAFSGTNPVPVTALSVSILHTTGEDTRTVTGTVAGVPCTLKRTGKGFYPNQVETYTLTPTSASTTAVPANSSFIPDEAIANRDAIQLLWMGRNDVPAVSDSRTFIDSAVRYINQPARFLIIGVPPSLVEPKNSDNFNLIEAFNAALAASYPDNYVSITPPTDAEMAAVGYTPNEKDKSNIANGLFPTGMHTNDIHFTTKGYQIVVNRLAAKLKAKSW